MKKPFLFVWFTPFFSGNIFLTEDLSWKKFWVWNLSAICKASVHVTMTTGNPYRRCVVYMGSQIIAPLLLLFDKEKMIFHINIVLSPPIDPLPSETNLQENKTIVEDMSISIWLREVNINSVKITQVADWVTETLKIRKTYWLNRKLEDWKT